MPRGKPSTPRKTAAKKSAPAKKPAAGRKQATPVAPPEKNALPETPVARKATNGVTETEIKQFLVRATNLATEEDRIKSDLASIRSRQRILKKDLTNRGGNYETFKILFATSKMSENDAQVWLDQVVDYHAMINIRVSFDEATGQGSLTDVMDPPPKTEGDRDLDAAQAYQDGYKAGLKGAPEDDCLYQPGTIQFVKWREGCRDGNSAGKVASSMKEQIADEAA